MCFLCVLIFTQSNFLIGQNIQYKEYGQADGLGENEFLNILVLKDNRVVIGTGHGLLFYNGNKFNQIGSKGGSSSSIILHLEQFNNGNILLTTMKGVYIYDGNKFHDTGWLQKFKDQLVLSARIFNANTIFVLGEKGLFKVNGKVAEIKLPETLNNTRIIDFDLDKNGCFYFHTEIGDFALDNQKLIPIPESNSYFIKDCNGGISYGTTESVCSYKNGILIKTVKLDEIEERQPLRGKNLIMIRDGAIYYHDETGFCKQTFDKENLPYKFNETVMDKLGNIWATNRYEFVKVFPSIYTPVKLPSYKSMVASVAEVKNNTVQYFTEDNKLWNYNIATKTSVQDLIFERALSGTKIGPGNFFGTYFSTNQEIWINHLTDGMYLYKNGKFDLAEKFYPALKGKLAQKICTYSQDEVVIVYLNEIAILNLKTKEAKWHPHTYEIWPMNPIAYQGKVYIPCEKGLLIFNNGKYNLIDINTFKGATSIVNIYQIGNNLWLNTLDGGVFCWDIGQAKVVKQVTITEGLLDNSPRRIAVDNRNNLWTLFNNGVVFTDLSSKPYKSTVFTKTNGLYDGKIMGYFTEGLNGKFYVSTTGSFSEIDFDAVYKLPPQRVEKIVLNSVYVNNIDLNIGHLLIDNVYDLKLKYYENTLNFKFDAIAHIDKELLTYQYKFADDKGNWIDAPSSGEISLIRMPYGSFKLLVRAGINGTNWSEPFVLNLKILPPWWKTNWFLILICLLIGITIYFLFKYRINQLNKAAVEAQIKAEMQQQITESELTALKSQIEPHFIQNVFAFLAYKIRSGDSIENSIQVLKQTSVWFKRVLQLSDSAVHTVAEEIEILNEYINLYTLIYPGKFEFKLNNEIAQSDFIYIPTMILQPFVENAIKHGFSVESSNNILTINFNEVNDFIIVRINDNGKGFNTQNTKFSKSFEVTKKRLNLATKGLGEITIISENGTTIEIKIPNK